MAQKPGAPKETAAPAQWLHVRELKPWGRNPRRNAQAVEPLARAIRTHGFGAPLVAQAGTLRIVAGHTRRLAVQHLLRDAPGWEIPGSPGPGYVPVRVLEVSDEDATALALADNNRALQGEWDDEALASLLAEMDETALDAISFAAAETKEAPLTVEEVDTSTLEDERFWLSVSGPLPSQPDALEALRVALAALPGVEVQMGKG